MLERLRGGESLETLARGEALDTVFAYFAGLIFDNAGEEMREVLMKSACLPRVSAALLEAVTGKTDAIRHIEELHRRRLFTDRSAGDEITYQFHALFRVFLKSRAAVAYTMNEQREIARRAASSLAAAGQFENAFALYAEAEDWAAAERLLLESAAKLIEQGRWQTLGQWIEALPQARLDANPWVRYWLGRSTTFVDPATARPQLETAYQAFADAGDEVGQLLSATTILEGIYFEFENLRPMDPWIERLVALIGKGVRPPTREDDLRANSAVLMGATFRVPGHSMLEPCLHRVQELLKEPFDANIKVAAACMLHEYAAVAMDPEAERNAILVARPLLDSPRLSAHRAFHYFQAEGYTHYLHGRYTQAFACFDAADALKRENALPDGNSMLVECQRGLCERRSGLLDRAEETIRRIESRPMSASGQLKGALNALKAGVAFDRGDMPRAIETILVAYRCFDDAGDFGGTVLVGTIAANMAIAGNRFDVADQMFSRLEDQEYGAAAENYLAAIILNQAWLAHRQGDSGSRDMLLGEALQRARMEGARARLALVCECHGGVAAYRDIDRNRGRYGARAGTGVLRGAASAGHRGLAVAGEGVHARTLRIAGGRGKPGLFAQGTQESTVAAQGDHCVRQQGRAGASTARRALAGRGRRRGVPVADRDPASSAQTARQCQGNPADRRRDCA